MEKAVAWHELSSAKLGIRGDTVMKKTWITLILLATTACGRWQVSLDQKQDPVIASEMPATSATPASSAKPESPLTNLIPGFVYETNGEYYLINSDHQPQLLPIEHDFIPSPTNSWALYNSEGDQWVADLATGEKRNLTEAIDDWVCCGQWWPGHPNEILYTSILENSSHEPSVIGVLTKFDLTTNQATPLIPDHLLNSFSPHPDGNRIAIQSTMGAYRYFDTTRTILPFYAEEYGFRFPIELLYSPAYSPDGTKLVWRADWIGVNPGNLNNLSSSGVLLFDLNERTVNEIGNIHQFNIDKLPPPPPKFSPNGRYLAAEKIEIGEKDISIHYPQHTSRFLYAENPIWSPNSIWIVFYKTYAEETQILWSEYEEPESLDLPIPNRPVAWLDLSLLDTGTSLPDVNESIQDNAQPPVVTGMDLSTLLVLQTHSEQDLREFGDIGIIHADGSDFQTLTDYGYNRDPVLSPNGSRIAYRSVPITITDLEDPGTRLNEGTYNIWVISTDGEKSWQLTDSEEPRSIPDWSPDGSTLIFSQGVEGSLLEIKIGFSQTVLRSGAFNPQYSPAGNAIAFITPDGGLAWIDEDNHEHWVVSPESLAPEQRVSDFDWFPGGDELFYTLMDESERAESTTIGNQSAIWVNSIDGSNPVQLTDFGREIKISPDGGWALITTGNGHVDACVVNKETTVFKIASNHNSIKQIHLHEFSGFPEISMGDFYPVGEPRWIVETVLAGGFVETCPEGTGDDSGGYLIDVAGQKMLRFTDQILDSPSW
jgi:Tol biopolymer transport system component